MRISDWSSDVCSSDLQRVRSPEIQLAVGKLLRELRRQGPHAKRVNHQVSAAGRPKVGDVDLELQRRVRSAEGGRESYVPRLPGLQPNAPACTLVVRPSKSPTAQHKSDTPRGRTESVRTGWSQGLPCPQQK